MRYHNQTAAQKEMLEFARQYLQDDDEVPDVGCTWVLLAVLLGRAGCCGWVLEGSDPPKPALEQRLGVRLPSPPASSCPPVLQMELDGGEGPEVLDLPSDGEFEGDGDYEEGFFAEWWQEPKTKGDKDDQGS